MSSRKDRAHTQLADSLVNIASSGQTREQNWQCTQASSLPGVTSGMRYPLPFTMFDSRSTSRGQNSIQIPQPLHLLGMIYSWPRGTRTSWRLSGSRPKLFVAIRFSQYEFDSMQVKPKSVCQIPGQASSDNLQEYARQKSHQVCIIDASLEIFNYVSTYMLLRIRRPILRSWAIIRCLDGTGINALQ